jgi:beta-glucosidase
LSKENDGTPASAAFDGNTGTRWSSQASDPQWIYVNLGAHATINKVVLNWENAYATAYQIQVSDDATNWTDIYSTTTGTGGIQTINVSGAGQYVRMYGTARATPYGYSLWEFQVFGSFDSGGGGCGTANVAQGQPATALSKENDGTPASAAFDGNTGTRWSSQFGDPQWIYVNLGAPVTVCQVVLNWESAYATAFQIQVSNDATNWTDIYSTTTGTGGIQTINASGTGQYVRMYGTARATPYGYSIWEFAVHTTGGGGTTNVAQGKPATADSSCATAETPDKAFNGSVSGGAGDKWCSLSSNRWLQVNLGQTYQVTSFILRNAGAGGENQAWDTRDADILVSTDGSTWSTAAQIRGNTADVTTVNLSSPVAAQYVKLNVITPTNTTDPAARIYEFEVYA